MGTRAPLFVIGDEHSDDQRRQAFESIFGRPSAAHRGTQPIDHHRQQYQGTTNPTKQPYGYSYEDHRSNHNPPSLGSTGVIASPPPIVSDSFLDTFNNQRLTPAQAYQAKVSTEASRGASPNAYHPAQTASYNDPLPSSPILDSLAQPGDGEHFSLDLSPTRQNSANFDDEPGEDSELPWASVGQMLRNYHLIALLCVRADRLSSSDQRFISKSGRSTRKLALQY